MNPPLVSPPSHAPVDTPITWADPGREQAFAAWLGAIEARHALARSTLRSASSDASFRRYFRIDASSGASFIIMDAASCSTTCGAFSPAACSRPATVMNGPTSSSGGGACHAGDLFTEDCVYPIETHTHSFLTSQDEH